MERNWKKLSQTVEATRIANFPTFLHLWQFHEMMSTGKTSKWEGQTGRTGKRELDDTTSTSLIRNDKFIVTVSLKHEGRNERGKRHLGKPRCEGITYATKVHRHLHRGR